MFLSILLALVLGCFAGVITGLTPGIHINLVAVLVLSASAFLLKFTSPIVVACFVIAMAITHTFLDCIPSIFLGAPDADMVLAVLPGHKLLLEGKGHEAVRLTVEGSLLCLLLGIALVPILIPGFPILYHFLRDKIGYIILGIVLWLIFREKNKNKRFWSAFVFITAGILGVIVLGTPSLKEPLLPMLSGLFGISILFMSMFEKVELPPQRITDQMHADKKESIHALAAGTLSGAVISLLPGLGPAQAAIMSTAAFKSRGILGYLILVGGINTVNFLVSLVTMHTLLKARNGAMIAVLEIVQSVSFLELLLYLTLAVVVGGIATILTLRIARIFSRVISKVNYRMLCGGMIAFIAGLVFFFSGILGIFILILSTAIGIVPQLTGTGKNHAMGCLLLPVMLYFLL